MGHIADWNVFKHAKQTPMVLTNARKGGGWLGGRKFEKPLLRAEGIARY